MAKKKTMQPIKSTDLVNKNVFPNLIKNAEQLIKKYDQLEKKIKKIIALQKKIA